MQPSPFSRMLWKETREHLPLATAIVLGSTVLQLLWISILHNAPTSEYSQALTLIPAALAAAFALCAGSLMFANERESETLDFLRRLPTNPAFIFRVKFCAGILSTFALVALLTPIALLLVYWKGSLSDLGTSESSAEHLTSVLVFAHLFIWGMFFSLLTGKVLRSLFLGIIATMIARQAYPYDSLILVLGLIVCYMMKTRWFYETPRSSRRIFPAISIQVELPTVQISLPSFLDAKASASTRALGRLLWLELNRAKTFLLLALLFYVIAKSFFYLNIQRGVLDQLAQGFPFGPNACTIGLLPFFAGLASYSSDQLRQQFRFLGERGVTPRHVYRSKFIIWFLLTSFLPMFLLLVASSSIYYRFSSDDEIRAHIIGIFTALALCYSIGLTAYSIGQLASLLVQSRILAASLALFLAFLVAGWINSLYQYRYGPEIIAPQVILIPLILLIAARLRVRNWLRERNSLGSWLKYLTLALFLPLSICFASVPLYRAYSIPQVQPLNYSLTPRKLDFPDPATRLFAIRTAIEIRCMGDSGSPDFRLSELFTSSRPTDGYNPYGLWYAPLSPAESGWQHATSSEKKWIEQHRTWLNNSKVLDSQTVALSPEFQTRSLSSIIRAPYQLLRLAYLHHLEGSRLASEGDLNAALQHHLHALRLAGLRWKLDQNIAYQDLQTRFKPFWESELLTAWSLRWLQSWTLHPSQTRESLAAAIPQLEQSLQDLASPSQSGQLLAQAFEKNVATAEFGSPWENERHRRLARIAARQEVNNGFSADRRLVKGRESFHTNNHDWQQVNNQPTDDQSINERHQLQKIIDSRLQSEDRQFYRALSYWTDHARQLYRWRIIAFQALELSMALNAWRIEHGSFPSTLQPLVGPYFDVIPRFNLGHISTERSRHPYTYLPEGLDGNLALLTDNRQATLPEQARPLLSLAAKTPFIMFSDRGSPAFIPHPTKDGHAFNIDPSNQWQFHPTSPHLLFGHCDFILLPLIPTELLKSAQPSNGTARAFLPTPPRPATTRPTDTNTPD